jgi:hypothetical protein
VAITNDYPINTGAHSKVVEPRHRLVLPNQSNRLIMASVMTYRPCTGAKCRRALLDYLSAILGACKPVLEDGPDISGSEESSDHGEEITDGYTPDCPTAEQARISEETMRLLTERGRAGGLGTVPRANLPMRISLAS